jgi:hypothetical protein
MDYLNAHLSMVYECRVAGSGVVVVSPFVMGGGRSNRFARRYAAALSEQLPRSQDIYFMDAHAVLSQLPRHQMLLGDGFHLSPLAHQKLGAALTSVLAEAARRRIHVRHPASGQSRNAGYNLMAANRSPADLKPEKINSAASLIGPLRLSGQVGQAAGRGVNGEGKVFQAGCDPETN